MTAARSWLTSVLVAAIAFAAYANTLTHPFTLDDALIIVENPQIRDLGNVPRLFTQHYWAGQPAPPSRGLYRPLTVGSYAVNYALHGLSPAGYHVVNVVLHALATGLLHRLLTGLVGAGFAAFAAALLFAVHPIHTEAVANVAGRAELLAACGVLLCCVGYERARAAAEQGRRKRCGLWIGVSAVAYLGGALSKEIGVLAPVVIALTEALFPQQRWLLRRRPAALAAFAAYAAAAVTFLALRALATEGNEAAGIWRQVSDGQRIATALRVTLEYGGLLLVPWTLLAEYAPADVPIAKSAAAPAVLLAGLVLAATTGVAIALRRRLPAFTWGLAVFAVTLLPVSNLLFPIGILKAERILYMPSAGFLTGVAAALTVLAGRPRGRAITWVVLAGVALAYAARTWVRNADWRSPDALCDATLAVSPNSPIFNTHRAARLLREGRRAEARERLQFVLSVAPRSVAALQHLAQLELDERNYDAAIVTLRRLLAIQPDRVESLAQLAAALLANAEWDEGISTLERLRTLRPDDPRSHLAVVHAQLGRRRPDLALPIVEATVRRFPRHGLSHMFAAWVYSELGRAAEAEAARRRALELDPTLDRAPPRP